ncbi:unnamed protein product, partial [Rotaria sp. Silwood2]
RKEADELKLDVAKQRVAEAAAHEKLLAIIQFNQSLVISNTTTHAQHTFLQPPSQTI